MLEIKHLKPLINLIKRVFLVWKKRDSLSVSFFVQYQVFLKKSHKADSMVHKNDCEITS